MKPTHVREQGAIRKACSPRFTARGRPGAPSPASRWIVAGGEGARKGRRRMGDGPCLGSQLARLGPPRPAHIRWLEAREPASSARPHALESGARGSRPRPPPEGGPEGKEPGGGWRLRKTPGPSTLPQPGADDGSAP